MNLECSKLKNSVRLAETAAEPLQDGIGDNSDEVCRSYKAFHKDADQGIGDLRGCVHLADECCQDLKAVEPETLKRHGSELIRRISNYPSSFS